MGAISLQAVGIFFAALLVLFILGWLLALPGRTLLRFFGHALSGGLLLLAARLIAPVTGILPSVNPATLAVSIFLGRRGRCWWWERRLFLREKGNQWRLLFD